MDRTQSEGHQAFMFTAKTFRRRIASDGQLGTWTTAGQSLAVLVLFTNVECPLIPARQVP